MSCLSSNPCPACLPIHVLPVFSHHQVVASMWAPWPGYAVPSRMWRLLLEADSPSKVVHQTQPHELPIIDSRDHWPRLKTVDGAATISYVEPGTTISSTGTVLQQPSQPLSPHQCSAGAACHDGTQPPCSPPMTNDGSWGGSAPGWPWDPNAPAPRAWEQTFEGRYERLLETAKLVL